MWCKGAIFFDMTTSQKYAIKNKERIRAMRIEWIIKNKEKLVADKKRWDIKNKEKIRQYIATNRDRINAYARSWKKNNPEKIKEQNRKYKKKYKEKYPEKFKNSIKKYEFKNKEQIKKQKALYRLNNLDKINAQRKLSAPKHRNMANAWQKRKRSEDVLFKLSGDIRKGIYKSMKRYGYTKRSKTNQILGCDYETFKQHIERQFTKGMGWDNSGKWHFDHIVPVSSAKTEDEIIKLNHYTNFQPLWARDNIVKGNKIIETQLVLI